MYVGAMLHDSTGLLNRTAALASEAEAYVSRALGSIGRARALVSRNRHEAAELLTARRYELVRHLGEYQRFKHGRIFNPMIAAGSAGDQTTARAMKCDCIAMGEMFGGYHTRWSYMEAQDWPAYRRDMLTTSEMLSVHLEAEHQAILKLIPFLPHCSEAL